LNVIITFSICRQKQAILFPFLKKAVPSKNSDLRPEKAHLLLTLSFAVANTSFSAKESSARQRGNLFGQLAGGPHLAALRRNLYSGILQARSPPAGRSDHRTQVPGWPLVGWKYLPTLFPGWTCLDNGWVMTGMWSPQEGIRAQNLPTRGKSVPISAATLWESSLPLNKLVLSKMNQVL